eukprot:TRINITY_DN36079_c0_g2_i1.p1 TRINITY_DN36079_c0_g2~~TRINITY_DN36079_c0_g2_i1.p1  ORF type:complete len:266 (+),score=88.17 TRINITY_DN36079_c0_g2_i1:80-877(+)
MASPLHSPGGHAGGLPGCAGCEDLRRRLARGIVVIEALRKRVHELEGIALNSNAVATASSNLGLGGDFGGHVGLSGYDALNAAEFTPGSPTTAWEMSQRKVQLALQEKELQESQHRHQRAALEASQAREVIIDLEARLAERDAQVARLLSDLAAAEQREDRRQASPHRSRHDGPFQPSDEVHVQHQELIDLRKKLHNSQLETKKAKDAKVAAEERLRSEALGRDIMDSQHKRFQRMHSQLVELVEEKVEKATQDLARRKGGASPR